MPSWTMVLTSKHGTTPLAAPPSPSNDCSTSSGPRGNWRVTVKLLSNTTAQRIAVEIGGCDDFDFPPQTTQAYNPTARVELKEQVTINRRRI
jgi:hypothetical protein